MTLQRPNNMARPFPPTLHLDNQRAWRQGEDAVFLPIVYDQPVIKPAKPDAIIIQVTLTLQEISLNDPMVDRREESALVNSETELSVSGMFQETAATHDSFTPPSAEALSGEEKRKNLALLMRKAETGDFRAPNQTRKDHSKVDLSFSDAAPPKSKRLSKSVPLLLLSVLALVFFTWIAFR
ncbi:MAG: hypothetical protein ABI977_15470 [Acidobacteriota bacterium]